MNHAISAQDFNVIHLENKQNFNVKPSLVLFSPPE